MYRKFSFALAFLLLQSPAWASLILDSSSRGWVANDPSIGRRGGVLNNYFAGYEPTVAAFRDWFAFAIPVFSGSTLTSASLNLDEPSATEAPNYTPGHLGGPLTYSVYGLAGEPLAFTDIAPANPFGSVATSNADDGSTIVINLNSAALAAIAANQGETLYIGGIDSGEMLTSGANGDFSGTQGEGVVSLTLNLQRTAVVPEPSTAILFAGAGLLLLIAFPRARMAVGPASSLPPRVPYSAPTAPRLLPSGIPRQTRRSAQ